MPYTESETCPDVSMTRVRMRYGVAESTTKWAATPDSRLWLLTTDHKESRVF
jgi:hypothetical protein